MLENCRFKCIYFRPILSHYIHLKMTTNDKETTEHIKLNCLFPMQYAKQCKIKALLLCYDHGKILKSTTRYAI